MLAPERARRYAALALAFLCMGADARADMTMFPLPDGGSVLTSVASLIALAAMLGCGGRFVIALFQRGSDRPSPFRYLGYAAVCCVAWIALASADSSLAWSARRKQREDLFRQRQLQRPPLPVLTPAPPTPASPTR